MKIVAVCTGLVIIALAAGVFFCTDKMDSSDSSTENIPSESDSWTLYEDDLHPEIEGGWHTNDGRFYTSGGNEIWVRLENEKRQVYHEANVKMHKMWGSDDGIVWTVAGASGGGHLIKCQQETCEKTLFVPNYSFYGIAGTTDGIIYIAGIKMIGDKPWGVVVSTTDGLATEVVYEKEGYWLIDIWSDPNGDAVVAVGQSLGGISGRGIVVSRGENGIWKEVDVNVDDFVYLSIWGITKNEIYIVGQIIIEDGWVLGEKPFSVVLRGDATSFFQVMESSIYKYWSVWGRFPGEIFLGGAELAVLDNGFPSAIATRIIRWDSTDLYINETDVEEYTSAVTGFSGSSDGKIVYAYTNDAEIWERATTKE